MCIGRDYSDVMQRCSVLIGDSPAIGQDYTFWCLLGTLSDHKAFIQKFGCLGKRKITGSRLVCVRSLHDDPHQSQQVAPHLLVHSANRWWQVELKHRPMWSANLDILHNRYLNGLYCSWFLRWTSKFLPTI